MERLKALTVNIWNRQGPWEQRLPLLRAGIAALDADVVGLQEVLHLAAGGPDQADDIAAGLPRPHQVHYCPAWDMGGGLSFGNALLSRWPMLERAHWPLPVDGQTGRCLGYALLDAPCGRVPVFVTHLSWQFHLSDERCRQVRFIDDKVREVVPKDAFPPVLLGDFNAQPEADEVRFLRGLTPLGGRGT
jgi:endonuclease/exonuclease/phosphatase family metal-dependent hydrolase